MGKASIIFALGVLICALEETVGNGIYYWGYPNAQGAVSYQSPYDAYAALPMVPLDCDKEEGGSSEGSSSESSESSSEESKEGKSEKSSSESSSSSEETKEGSEEGKKEEGESKEGESKESESSSSESSSESKESKEKESKEGKKKKEKKPKFPPVTYAFPPRPIQQQYIYSPQPYMQYRPAYSVVQQPISYPVRSSYPYYSAGYAAGPVAIKGYPAGYAAAPAPVKGYPAPVARVVSSTMTKYMAPITYSVPISAGYSAPYWGSNGNYPYYLKK